jgi:hypothetical protein
MSPCRRHVVGAGAGLAPATVIIAYYLGTNGPVLPGLLLVIASPAVAGWLIGPRLDGTRGADVRGALAFLIAAYLLHAGFGVLVTGLANGRDIAGTLASLLEALGIGAFVTALYVPFWAVVLSPLALLWVVTARILRGRLSGGQAGGWRSPEPPSRRRRSATLRRPLAAALIGYTLGFTLTAPSQCIATSTAGAAASVKDLSTTVCASLIGMTYAGAGSFDPPRELAVTVGLVVAAVAVLAVAWVPRAGRIEPFAGASG